MKGLSYIWRMAMRRKTACLLVLLFELRGLILHLILSRLQILRLLSNSHNEPSKGQSSKQGIQSTKKIAKSAKLYMTL